MHNRPKNLICEIVFGSNLYGTATDTSDMDYVGIFLPTPEEILLGRIPKTANTTPKDDTRKNLPGELDCQYYSLHHFLRLATQGQTVAIDMLFAPDNCVNKTEEFGWVWDLIIAERDRLLSRKMNAFIGYARGQAAKFSLKGDRLNKLVNFRRILDNQARYFQDDNLASVWSVLPKDDERVNPNGIKELQIGGKWFGETTSTLVVFQSVSKMIAKYGNRAKTSANAGGLDWKALSHAVRVSKELIELLETGKLVFPLKDAPLLLDIKQGKLPIEEVRDILDRDLEIVEELADKNILPDRVDTKFWDEWLVNTMADYVAKSLADRRDDILQEEVRAHVPKVLAALNDSFYPFKVIILSRRDHYTGDPEMFILACVPDEDKESSAMDWLYEAVEPAFERKRAGMYVCWVSDEEEFYGILSEGDCEVMGAYAVVDASKYLGSLCKPKTPIAFSIPRDFSDKPGARYFKEGKWSGEELRMGKLKKAINQAVCLGYQLTIDLDGVASGYATSFLEEVFGGLIREGRYTLDELEKLIKIKCEDEPYLVEEIREYMLAASKNV